MNEEINRNYTETNPYSFGGKYRVYDVYPKSAVDEVAAFAIFLPALFIIGLKRLFNRRKIPPIPRPRCKRSPPLNLRDILFLLTIPSFFVSYKAS